MKILLVCAMGASTGVMVNKMKAAAESDSTIDKSNLEIRAISADSFKDNYKGNDVVLLGPQIRFKQKEFGELCSQEHIAMQIIPIADYGMMRGDNVLKLALKMYKDNN